MKSRNEYHQTRRKENKLKSIKYKGGKCVDCKKKYSPAVYDFHHLNIKKKDAKPTRLMMSSWEKIKKELDKCVLLCANCHRMRHENG